MQELINTVIKNRKPLLVGLGLLVIGVIWLGGSCVSLVHNKMEKSKLLNHSASLDKEYETLLHTKELLETQDPALVEEIARTEYGLAKPGQIEFRFTDK